MIDTTATFSRLPGALALLALLAFLVSLSVQAPALAVQRHILFALGVLPLVLGAMLYFVPVLTRSPAANGPIALVPWTVFATGCLVVFAMAQRPVWLPGLAGVVAVLVGIELSWVLRRRSRVLGSPHAGLDWYVFALGALIVALLAIVATSVWPAAWLALRNAHLHLNLFGFLGLTAIGTLRVLLPTTVGQPDPTSAVFLRRQLWWAVFGSVTIAAGAATWIPIAVIGSFAWIWTAVHLLSALRAWEGRSSSWHSASTSLVAAAFGWLLLLCIGVPHAFGKIGADAMFAVLIFGFVLPLVTGATSYLLPVWRWPGRALPAHGRMRERLMRFSGARVVAFWISALAGVWGHEQAFVPAAFALAIYLFQVLSAFRGVRETRAC